MRDDFLYYVIVRRGGDLQIQGVGYKTRDAAERRADAIQGGETHVFATYETDKNRVLSEFRDEELAKL